MGGFVFIHKAVDRNWAAKKAAALDTFAQIGLRHPRVIERTDYVLAVFPKRQAQEAEFEEFVNGDFVCTCGTLFYNNKVGKEAAVNFFNNYSGPSTHQEAMGHYVVIICKDGYTDVITDSFGGFHVFCDSGMRVAASSFLVTTSALDRVTLGAQAAYEYVFNGVVSGDSTLFNEIVLAPVNSALSSRNGKFDVVRRSPRVPTTATDVPRKLAIKHSIELLDKYFSVVADNFQNRVTCALSGGYDSRLILAFLRRHGIRPRLFVYGTSRDSDVILARAIAEGESFELEVIDKNAGSVPPTAEFARAVHQNFLASDGYLWGGIFQNEAETGERARRVAGNSISLNGGGGEILRNFFYLLNYSYSPRELLWSFYSRFDPGACTSAFDEEVYLQRLESKIEVLIGGRHRSLPRPLVEWLYHNFRCRAWDGRVNSINGTFGYTALPFLERSLTEHASTIPIAWKNHGAYEAELIRHVDPRLAAYHSNYGHNFIGPPPLRRRLADYSTYLRPTRLRRLSYRIQQRVRRKSPLPTYLTQPYRDAVLPDGAPVMSALFRLDRITDAEQTARILSLEYAVKQFGGRIRFDFDRPDVGR